MKRTFRYLPLLALPLLGTQFARGQAAVDINMGFGSLHDKANSGGFDSPASTNAFGACVPNSGDADCESLSAMSGFFLGFGGDVMFKQKFGAGFNASVQPSRENYGPFLSRETFYDVDGIYQPITQKRFALRFQGGIGAARTSLAVNESNCTGTTACGVSTLPVGNVSHFDVHFAAGVQIYVTEHVFIRPEFDLHYAPGLDNQFGSNLVPGGMIWIGYNIGHNQ